MINNLSINSEIRGESFALLQLIAVDYGDVFVSSIENQYNDLSILTKLIELLDIVLPFEENHQQTYSKILRLLNGYLRIDDVEIKIKIINLIDRKINNNTVDRFFDSGLISSLLLLLSNESVKANVQSVLMHIGNRHITLNYSGGEQGRNSAKIRVELFNIRYYLSNNYFEIIDVKILDQIFKYFAGKRSPNTCLCEWINFSVDSEE